MRNFLGFHSFDDFLTSLFRLKDWSINTTFAIIGLMTTFITNYMWDDPKAVWTLYALMLMDWITGVAKSMKNKSFVSYKLFRAPMFFIATSCIMGISWWMSKSSIVFTPLPPLVLCGFYSVTFVSLLENLGELELLPKSFVDILKNKFGIKTLIDKFMK